MYIRSLLWLLISCITLPTMAQLPDNSIAPDWQLTDINGIDHHLYNYLNDGKTVFISFSSTWCGSCWSYHLGGELATLYEKYGPPGTNEVMVIMIEADWNTNLDDLNGSGSYTYGDWISNTPYPIIDDHSLVNSYAINAWPMLYKICPNKRIEKVAPLPYEQLYKCSQQCSGPVGAHNVSILSYQGFQGPFCESVSFTPNIIIQNEGHQMLQFCQIELKQDGEVVYIKDWNGQIGPQQSFEFNFPVHDLYANSELSFHVKNPNDLPDDDPTDNELAGIHFKTPVARQMVRLRLHTDLWPEENQWWLRRADSTVIYSSGSIPLEPNTTYHYSFELESGNCYIFEMIDLYGDGLLHGHVSPGVYVPGALVLESDIGVLWDDPNIGFGIKFPFKVDENAVSLDDQRSNQAAMRLFPNPADDYVQLAFHSTQLQKIQIQLINSVGNVLLQEQHSAIPYGQQQFQLSTTTLVEGLYFLSLKTDTGTFIERFVVQR